MPRGQPNGDRVNWDDATEKHLLLVILANSSTSGLNWAAIANQFGGSLTASAAQQKYGKIKKRDSDIFNGAANGTSTPGKDKAVAATPSKRGRGKTAAADVDDDDEEMETPVKKVKKTPKKERKDSYEDLGFPIKDEVEEEGV